MITSFAVCSQAQIKFILREKEQKTGCWLVVNAGVGLVGLTCQRAGGYRPPGAKGDGEDPNQHIRAADFASLCDECGHRHNHDGLHLHISANVADSCVGVENVIKAVSLVSIPLSKKTARRSFRSSKLLLLLLLL